MKVENIKNIDKFFSVVEKCKGKVELVTPEGDRLNLKSTLTKYVALAKAFSDGNIGCMEIIAYEVEDAQLIMKFMHENK